MKLNYETNWFYKVLYSIEVAVFDVSIQISLLHKKITKRIRIKCMFVASSNCLLRVEMHVLAYEFMYAPHISFAWFCFILRAAKTLKFFFFQSFTFLLLLIRIGSHLIHSINLLYNRIVVSNRSFYESHAI